MKQFQATIDSLAFGGSGVCRVDGKVCFVPFSCPGDQVSLAVTAEKRSYFQASITEVLSPSPRRVSPACPHFGICGGCSWQHIDYGEQCAAKRSILAEALWRGARVPAELVGETVAAPQAYGYRSRVQFKLFAAPDRLHIGFYRGTTHRVVDLPSGCPVARPEINLALAELRPLLEGYSGRNRIPQVNLECGDEGCVAVINYIGDDRQGLIALLERNRGRLGSLSGMWLQTGRKSTLTRLWGDEFLYYGMQAGHGRMIRLGFAPGGFSQVNRDQNRALVTIIRESGALRSDGDLLDLYCGNGNLSLPLAGEVREITGIEEYQGSIDLAECNKQGNGISNATYLSDDAVSAVRLLAESGRRFSTVLLDPPRSGAADVASILGRLRSEAIIYVSCDPATMARDCGILAGQGYRVRSSRPIDMFPHTYHIESITLLTPSS